MKNVIALLVHLLAGLAALLGSGGTRAVLAENMLLKQQLLVLQRSRRRAPNLRTADRLLFGFCAQFLSPRRLTRSAIILKPATLLRLHRMFNEAICGEGLPVRLSFDHDPLFQFQRWWANLRILGVEAVQTVPLVPCSHPFVDRLIGSLRSIWITYSIGMPGTWNESWSC